MKDNYSSVKTCIQMWKHLSTNRREFQVHSQVQGQEGQVQTWNKNKKKKGATYQEKYRKKLAEINNTNAEFMEYASEQAPELVRRFFNEKAKCFIIL